MLFEVPSREAGFLKNLEKPMEKLYFLGFRGLKNRPKPGPDTASSRTRAERPSWGALGIAFGAIWRPFGVPSGGRKSVKKALEKKLKSNIAFDAHFGPSGGPLGHFLGPFWRYYWVLF